MKITHLIFALNTGGAETMLVDILNEQVKSESVSLIIMNKGINKELFNEIDERVNIIEIGRKEKSRSLFPIFKLNWNLLLISADVIHCHQHSAIRMIINKKNVVLTSHTLEMPIDNLKFYQKVFAISKAVKTDIENRTNIIPVLVYNGIKTNEIEQKENYGFNIFRIVQVSRLNHNHKGQHLLLEALEILVYQKNIKNITVDFIGEGESLSYLKELTSKLRLVRYVNFKGIKDRGYIYKHLKDYDLLIQPSIFEGFGLTIAEAMVAKVPVLVSAIEGPMEVIGNGKYGSFFKMGDIDDCADKIEFIIENYKKIKVEASEGIGFANKYFSIKLTSTNYINLYNN